VARRHTQAQNPQVSEFDIRMLTGFIPAVHCLSAGGYHLLITLILLIPHLGGNPGFFLVKTCCEHVYPLLIKRGWLENHPTKWMFIWENPSIHEGFSSKPLIPRG